MDSITKVDVRLKGLKQQLQELHQLLASAYHSA